MDYIALFSCVGDIIGNADTNDLVVYDKDDMSHFKNTTMGEIVIMGRKTVESLPARLEGRTTVCLTRDTRYTNSKADVILNSVESVLVFCEERSFYDGAEKAFICGGAETLDMFSDVIDEMIVTRFWGTVDIPSPVTIPSSITLKMNSMNGEYIRENDRFEIIKFK